MRVITTYEFGRFPFPGNRRCRHHHQLNTNTEWLAQTIKPGSEATTCRPLAGTYTSKHPLEVNPTGTCQNIPTSGTFVAESWTGFPARRNRYSGELPNKKMGGRGTQELLHLETGSINPPQKSWGGTSKRERKSSYRGDPPRARHDHDKNPNQSSLFFRRA